jgi:hypothetical protein
MSKKILITEDKIIAKIQDLLIEVDADELARITGELFGGECYYFADGYHFYPDENYCGGFGDIEND